MVKIWIDAGHGGSDSGATGNGLLEKNIVAEIARQLNNILNTEYSGVETSMTRMDDTFVPLSERANRANTWNADAFLSIHCNSGGGKGFESYRYIGTSGRTAGFQNAIHTKVMDFYRQYGIVDRGQKTADYAVLRETKMIAVLTENLFMDNVEITKFNDLNFLIGVARAHAEGLAQFFGIQKLSNEPPANTPYRVIVDDITYAQAKQLVIQLKTQGYNNTYGEAK